MGYDSQLSDYNAPSWNISGQVFQGTDFGKCCSYLRRCHSKATTPVHISGGQTAFRARMELCKIGGSFPFP